MEPNIPGNAVRLVGELLVPGASQLVSGNIKSGIAHNLLAVTAGAALIGTGIAPALGALAILGIKLNSYATAATDRSLVSMGSEFIEAGTARLRAQSAEPTPVARRRGADVKEAPAT